MKNKVWFLAVMLLVVLVAGCGSSDPAPPCTLSGTITNLNYRDATVLVSGVTYTLQFDTDTTYNNGNEAGKFHATWTGDNHTTGYSIDISSLPAGDYYLYVDIYPPPSYKLYGWYDGTARAFVPSPLKVPVSCGATYDLYIDIT